MPVSTLAEGQPAVHCGGCGADIEAEDPLIVYAFDELEEVSEEVRNGALNHARCSNCGGEGWAYPGTLIIDRSSSSGVFVDPDGHSNDFQKKLEHALEAARGLMEADAHSRLQSRIVRAMNYPSAFQRFECEEESFEKEAALEQAYWQRAAIAGPAERARKWFEDSQRIGSFTVMGSERHKEFLDAALPVIDEEKASGRWAEGPVQQVRDLLAGLAATAPIGMKQSDSRSPINTTPELQERLMELTGELVSTGREAADEIASTFDKALNTLLEAGSDGREKSLMPHGVQAALTRLEELTETQDADAEPGSTSLGESLRAAMLGGDRDGLIQLTGPVLSLGQRGGPNMKWALVTSVLASAAADCPADSVVAFLAYVNLSEYYRLQGESSLSAAIAARAVTQLMPRAGLIEIPLAVMTILGTVWQQLGRHLYTAGDSANAVSCSTLGAVAFESVGRADGRIRCMLDALHHGRSSREYEQNIQSARDLLEELRELSEQGEATSFSVAGEIECLCLMAEMTFERYEGPATQLVTKLQGAGEKTSAAGTGGLLGRVRGLFGRGSRAKTPDATQRQLFLPSQVPELHEDRRRELEPQIKNPAGGMVLNVERQLTSGESYIAGARVYDVEWFDYLQQAAELAAEHRVEQRWWIVQQMLVDFSQRMVGDPTRQYFYELALQEAKRLGFTLPQSDSSSG